MSQQLTPKNALANYRYRISRFIKSQITAGNQIWSHQLHPNEEELKSPEDFWSDPLQEESVSPTTAIIRKYPNKALLLVTRECPVYCRFCTRKRRTLSIDAPSVYDEEIENALDWIAKDCQIQEVILSGGDPWMLSDRRLFAILDRIAKIPHIHYIRLHSRTSTTLPTRFSSKHWQFWEKWQKENLFSGSHLSLAWVIHINHPEEITPESIQIWSKAQKIGARLLSQSVLLKNVNDNPDTLARLMKALDAHGVTPYYLHQLDKVQGSHHFQVDEARGRLIHEQLRDRIPIYLLPRYVRDGVSGKINLGY